MEKNSSDWCSVPITFLLAYITYLISVFLSSANFFLGPLSPQITFLPLKNGKKKPQPYTPCSNKFIDPESAGN